ncbi:MAG: radical SAM protein [Anaerolineae bacterium]|nr:radical SAM protein [Anaerolineae bacterium]MDW8070904.1 radical SAM protein [Anaerolineae bacterium]
MKPEILPPLDLTAPWPGVGSAPRELDIALTGRCNLRCRYCFYADEMTALSDLPTERWLRFFEEAGAAAVQRVCLSGGEVFTRPDLFTLIDGIIANRMRYTLLTNGTLITERTIAQFAVGKRRLRLDSIQVSIDGSCAAVHDRSRPPASFERALHALRLLKANDFPVTARVTINRHNVDDLEAIARLLLEDIRLPGFSTNEVEQMGTARCYGQDVVLTEAERRRAMETLTRLNKRYGGRISASAGPLARARIFREIEECLARGESGMPGRGKLVSCSGVFTKMAVLHDGTMVPCNMLPKLTMGVIGVNRLKDVWTSHPAINVVRARQYIPLSALSECADCPYTGFCVGGCPASVMARTGRIIGRDELSCYRLYRSWRER